MKLLIDGDGCPVVDVTIAIAARHGIPVTILCDTAHSIQREGAKTIVVSQGQDSVDFVLVNLLARGDVAITQDFGLAALCLARGAYPLRQDGLEYTDYNIDGLLQARHTAAKVRRGGGRLKGPSARTKGDEEAYKTALEALLTRLQKCEN